MTYVDIFRDCHQLAALLPLIEEDPLLILSAMSEHSFEELLFEVTLGRPHLEAVKHKSKTPLNKTLENIAEAVGTESLVFLAAFAGADAHLVPVLERLCLVKELHAL